jgi:hypothetical protein
MVPPVLSAQMQPDGRTGGQSSINIPLNRYSAKPPLGDSTKRPAESSIQKSSRAALERYFGGPDWLGYFGTIEDAGPGMNGALESVALTFEDVEGVEAFPPDAQCAVIGVVAAAEAFLSADRKYVYSDFQVKVETVLKQDQEQPVGPGDVVIASRTGGSCDFLRAISRTSY